MNHDLTMKMSRTKLLELLRVNRDRHVGNYEEARVIYFDRLLLDLEKRRTEAEEGKFSNSIIDLQKPENMSKEYDRLITMLEMDESEEKVLNRADFANFVLDEWDWKYRAATVNSSYTGKWS